MEPKYAALILAYISAAMASPIKGMNNTTSIEYVEHHRERAKFSDGELVWYGPPSDGVEGQISPRDTSNDIWQRSGHCTIDGDPIRCDTHNTTRNNVCDALVTELNEDGSTTVPDSSRSVCYMGDSEHNVDCCVSWHNDVKKLEKGDLATPALRLMRKCTSNGISGKINWIWLRNVCTSICLSNRAGHC